MRTLLLSSSLLLSLSSSSLLLSSWAIKVNASPDMDSSFAFPRRWPNKRPTAAAEAANVNENNPVDDKKRKIPVSRVSPKFLLQPSTLFMRWTFLKTSITFLQLGTCLRQIWPIDNFLNLDFWPRVEFFIIGSPLAATIALIMLSAYTGTGGCLYNR